MTLVKFSTVIILIILIGSCVKAPQVEPGIIKKAPSNKVVSLKITTLSTMLVNFTGLGEWGYAALVEVEGKKILFDTGKNPETVLQNAQDLGINLSDVEHVFLSHNHGDHTGGLLTLRKELKKINPNALTKVHVATGIFAPRFNDDNQMRTNRMLAIKKELEADGVEIIVHENQHELFPGVWITGPIKRIHNEKNWYAGGKIKMNGDIIEDNIPEDQSLVIDTKEGFVLISGCGHAGIINTLEHIRTDIYNKEMLAVIGGFHLVNASDDHLKWTSDHLKDFGVSNIIGAHCTGINSLYTLRSLLNLSRSNAIVGSVGDSFDLEKGINAGAIAK